MNLNIAIVGDPEFASQFGKKGTESDITLYNYRKGDDTATFIHPTRYPEKLVSLLCSLENSEMVLLEIQEINAVLGEIIVAIDSFNITKGYIYLKNYLQSDQIIPLIKETAMADYIFTDIPPAELKEQFFELPLNTKLMDDGEGPIIPIDHFFNVKGIGPVILGIVRTGVVRKYDKLIIQPTEKPVIIRSIQTHDKDVDSADYGERVGLALKSVTTDDLDRGYVITNAISEVHSSDSIKLRINPGPYWKKPLEEGMVLHLSTLMQMRPSRVMSVTLEDEVLQKSDNSIQTGDSGQSDNSIQTGDSGQSDNSIPAGDSGQSDNSDQTEKISPRPSFIAEIQCDGPLVHHPSIPIIVTYLEGGKLRVIGPGRIVT